MPIPEYLDPVIRHAAARWNIDENYLRAVLMTESRGNVNTPDSVIVKNGVQLPGAQGIAQIIPSTARMLGVDPYNPYQAVDGAAHYLAMGLDAAERRGLPNPAEAALRYYNSGSLFGKTDPGYIPTTANYYQQELATADKRASIPSAEYWPPPTIENAASVQNLDPRWLHAAAIAQRVNINNPDAVGSLAASLNQQLSAAEARKAQGETVDPAQWAAQQIGVSPDMIGRHYASLGAVGPAPSDLQVLANAGAPGAASPQTVAALQQRGAAPLQWQPRGDSIAGGFIRFGGLPGRVGADPSNTTTEAANGRSPQQVLDYLRTLPDASLNGQPQLLSTGVSNDPSQIKLVPQQLDELQRAGAGPIAIVGVGTVAGNEGRSYFDLGQYNSQLGQYADDRGAQFLGGIPNAVVHPPPAYYKGALRDLGSPDQYMTPQAPAPAAQVPDLSRWGMQLDLVEPAAPAPPPEPASIPDWSWAPKVDLGATGG